MKRFVLCLLLASPAMGASYSIDEGGINSAVLDLDGTGVHIGQVEPFGRSGSYGYDTLPANYNTQVRSHQVYRGVVTVARDTFIDAHATIVASVMISDGSDASIEIGVAPGASLHSAGPSVGIDSYADMALAMNNLAEKDEMRAINLSWGTDLQGGETIMNNAYITEFVDWSSRVHSNVLYVAAHPYNFPGRTGPTPADNYNGITVASSERPDLMANDDFTKVWSENFYEDVPFLRSMTDILAPGDGLHVAELGNPSTSGAFPGSSLAAPHVTGTVALLQELGNNKLNMGDPGFLSLNYRKHQVMKAVIMNGADKLDGVLGSSRDVLKRNDHKWTDTQAYNLPSVSLDPELGVGHLNAKNSADNFEPGEYNPSIQFQLDTYVPTTGWDFGESGGVGVRQEYYFSQPISGWFSATLAWDRYVECTCGDEYDYGSQFFNPSLTNLDLYLLPADRDELHFAVDWSSDFNENLEHIFWEVSSGMYKLVVINNGGAGEPVEYGLAWRSGSGSSAQPGDFNGDTRVNGRDFLAWQRGESIRGPLDAQDLADWQANYGFGALEAVTVPEPSSMLLTVFATVALAARLRCASSSNTASTSLAVSR